MASPRRKIALVLGIERYESGMHSNPSENDARDIACELEKIGFVIIRLKLNLGVEEMEIELIQFKRQISTDDIVLFYFSGHGGSWMGKNYLIPRDAHDIDETNVRRKCIDVEQIIDAFIDRCPYVTICLLDCSRTQLWESRRSNNRGADNNGTWLQPMIAKAGCLIGFACAPGTVCGEAADHRNGLFTKHLLKYITTPNKDISDILRDVTKDVIEESHGSQVPFQSLSLTETNVFLNAV